LAVSRIAYTTAKGTVTLNAAGTLQPRIESYAENTESMLDGRGSADSHQIKYRPDLDGLRAVAVLSVIAYHLSNKALPGGYLGVDIFFALSGYLITKVIWREALTGSFSIARFYERRIRRIMPALVGLLLVVSACGIALLLPIDLMGYAKSAFATLAFVANVYFWRDTNYFSQLAEEKPLLHVWSLGVEEQFYIIFPLLVLLCIRWRRSALLPLVYTLVLFSLAANTLAMHLGAAGPAFFLIPTRAWELGAGALLALLPPARITTPWLRHALALLAAAFLIVGLCSNQTSLSLGGEIPNPLLVVLGTCLAMHLGNAGGSWLTRGLSMSVPVWIGLISYSLYLWHWPILVFTRYYLVRPLSPVETIAAVALMFALATLSWRYVERPFRDRAMPIRKVLAWVASGCVVVAIASVAILAGKGFPSRLNAEAARINSAVGTEYRCGMGDYIAFGASRGCVMSLPSRNPADATVALVGDSQAQMYAPIVTSILQADKREGLLVPANGCLPTFDFNESSRCMAIAAKNLSAVESLPRLRIVILAMTWTFVQPMYTPSGMVPAGSESKYLTASLDRLIQELQHRGKTVVLVGPISVPQWDVASVVSRELAFGHKIVQPLFVPEDAFIALEGDTIAHFASRDDITFIRPDRIQCQRGRCDYFRDGASLFADYNHIAQAALPLFRPSFEPALQRVLMQPNPPKP
jgi:peptidoglycan/LPS O-acetylase OafA/YrhL